MNNEGCLNNIIIGIVGFGVIIAFVKFLSPSPSKEDLQQANFCQDQAVSMNLGVTYDKNSKSYFYSKNKIEELKYYRFMYECLPDSYPPKKAIRKSLIDLENDLNIR